jgi:hypothetical protein
MSNCWYKSRRLAKATASILGLKVGTLELWRQLGKNLEYIQVGRKIMYSKKDISRFISENVKTITRTQNMKQILGILQLLN